MEASQRDELLLESRIFTDWSVGLQPAFGASDTQSRSQTGAPFHASGNGFVQVGQDPGLEPTEHVQGIRFVPCSDHASSRIDLTEYSTPLNP
jgi:hypothetical protein